MVPCLRVLPCGSFVGTTLPSDFLPAFLGPGVARSCAGAHVGLTARLGVTRHVPGSRHVGWVGRGGVGFLAWVISPLPRRSGGYWEDAPGCGTVPKPHWDIELRGCLGSRLARWLRPQLPGDGKAWLGWQGTSRCLRGQRERCKRPWGCLGLRVVTRVSEEPPWAEGTTSGKA